MDIPFFYTPDITASDDQYALNEASARHCVQVLRRRPGDAVMLTNGKGELWRAVIENADKKQCTVTILEAKKVNIPGPKTGIGISLTKNMARIEWFLEKATEIGIADIYPVQCRRTERTNYNTSRLKNIMTAAMLQSQQAYLPALHEQISLEEMIRRDGYAQKYIAHCEESERHFLGKALQPGEDTFILIGPEGDFTPEEIIAAKKAGFIPVSLGQTRLRTETAGIVACTLMNAANES